MHSRRGPVLPGAIAGLFAIMVAALILPAAPTVAQQKMEPAWGVGLFTGFKLRDPSMPYNSRTNPVVESRAWHTPVTELGPVVFSASIVTDRLSGQFCAKIQEGLSAADRQHYNCGGVYYSIYRSEAEARQFLDRRLSELRRSPSGWDIRMIEGVRIQTRDNARIMAPGTSSSRPAPGDAPAAPGIVNPPGDQSAEAARLNGAVSAQAAAVEQRNQARAAEYQRRQAEYEAQLARQQAEADRIKREDAARKADYDRQMRAWRKAVEECNAGKHASCVSPM